MGYFFKINEFLGIILGFITLFIVVLQVVSRYTGLFSFPWTEEVARFSFLWVVAFISGPVYLRKGYIAVSFFIEKLSEKNVIIMEFVHDSIVAIFSIVLIYAGYLLTINSTNQISPSAGINQGYVNFSICYVGINLFLAVSYATYLRCRKKTVLL